MSDFLGRLAGRALGTAPVVKPRVASRFAPDPAAPPLGEEGGWERSAEALTASEIEPARQGRASARGPRGDVAPDDARTSPALHVHAPERLAPPSAREPQAMVDEGAPPSLAPRPARVEADGAEARVSALDGPRAPRVAPEIEADSSVDPAAERAPSTAPERPAPPRPASIERSGEGHVARSPTAADATGSRRALGDAPPASAVAAPRAARVQPREGAGPGASRERAGLALVSEEEALLMPPARGAARPTMEVAIEPRAGAPVTTPRGQSVEPAAPQAPAILVRIGRVEVRAAPQAPARPADPRRPELLGLQDFLAGKAARR